MKRRVVITGMGAVTPIGNTIEEFWDGIRSGKSGIAPITHFDASEYKVKLAAEVKNFVAKERMDFKAAKRMESFPSMQWRQQKKHLKMQDWIWQRKIPTVSGQSLAQELVVWSVMKKIIKNCRSVVRDA